MHHAPPMARTPTHELADLKLGRPLAEYVAEGRAEGKAWRVIARDLYAETGIDVTYETLRSWFSTQEDAA